MKLPRAGPPLGRRLGAATTTSTDKPMTCKPNGIAQVTICGAVAQVLVDAIELR